MPIVYKILIFGCIKKDSTIRLLKAFCHLVLHVPAELQGCVVKIVGGVGFLALGFFFKKHYLQFSPV